MTTKTATALNGNLERTTEKIAAYNKQVVETRKTLTANLITSHEKTALRLADFQENTAGKLKVEWIAAVGAAQAGVTRALAKAYGGAAREILA